MGHAPWVVAVSACALAAAAPTSARQAVTFDARAWLEHGMTWSFTRDGETRDASGAHIASGSPRFGNPLLLCGAPDVTTVTGTALPITSIDVLATGKASDGVTPAFVVYNHDQYRFQVHVGQISGNGFQTIVGPIASKEGQSDLLRGSVDERADEAWVPKAALVCHGVVVVQCNVANPVASGEWLARRVGFAVCNISSLAGPPSLWWRRHAVSDVLTPTTGDIKIGKTWSMPGWWALDRDSAHPTKVWIASADYRASPYKDGGVYSVFPLTRPSAASAEWSAGPVCELPGRFSRFGANVTHAHAVGLARSGAHGMISIASRGDALYNAANYTCSIAEENDYLDDASLRPDSTNWYAPGPAWSGPLEVHGAVTTNSGPIERRLMANQWMGLAVGPVPGTFIVGSDEVNDALWLTSPISDRPAAIEFANLYSSSQSNTVVAESQMPGSRRRYLSFHVRSGAPEMDGFPYAAALNVSQFDPEKKASQRILFSPDGVNWGQCWSHGENEQTGPHVESGRIYVGAFGQGSGLGIRSIPIPATRLLRPLRTGSSGPNLLQTASEVHDVPGTVTVVPAPPLPSGAVTSPPCAGPTFRIINSPPDTASAVASLGTFRLTGAIPPATKRLALRMWVRADTLAEGGRAGCLAFKVRFRTINPDHPIGSTKVSGYSEPVTVCCTGEWFPIVFTTDVSKWGSQQGAAQLDMFIVTDNGTSLPGAFHLALDTLTNADSPTWPSVPGTVAGPETADLAGFSEPGDFTLLYAGMIPFDSWDQTDISPAVPARPLLTVLSESGSRWFQVSSDAPARSLVASSWNGSSDSAFAVVPGVYCMPGSPVLLGLRYRAGSGQISLRASVGGTIISGDTGFGAALDGPASTLRLGSPDGLGATPMDVFGAAVDGRAWTDAQIDAALRTLSFLPASSHCPSDFNVDGFATGDDFDAFTLAFGAGDASADFNGDGFVTGDDFDAYVAAFEQGC